MLWNFCREIVEHHFFLLKNTVSMPWISMASNNHIFLFEERILTFKGSPLKHNVIYIQNYHRVFEYGYLPPPSRYDRTSASGLVNNVKYIYYYCFYLKYIIWIRLSCAQISFVLKQRTDKTQDKFTWCLYSIKIKASWIL